MSLSLLELKAPPPIIFAISLLMAGLLNYFFPSAKLEKTTLIWILSGGCFLASGLIGLTSLAAFFRASTTVNPLKVKSATVLVDSGLYAFSRNPMYLALALLLLSICFYLANPFSLFGVLFFVVYITYFQIIPEERALLEIFGEKYRCYHKRVRRWL